MVMVMKENVTQWLTELFLIVFGAPSQKAKLCLQGEDQITAHMTQSSQNHKRLFQSDVSHQEQFISGIRQFVNNLK